MPLWKRELAAYIILSSLASLNGERIRIVDALNIFDLFYSRRTARKILRMLNNAGFIEIDGDAIRVRECCEALRIYFRDYIRSRAVRRLKSYNLGSVESRSIDVVTVECSRTDLDLCKKREIDIPGIIKVIFTHPQKTQ